MRNLAVTYIILFVLLSVSSSFQRCKSGTLAAGVRTERHRVLLGSNSAKANLMKQLRTDVGPYEAGPPINSFWFRFKEFMADVFGNEKYFDQTEFLLMLWNRGYAA
jgi:hypothetical protein